MADAGPLLRVENLRVVFGRPQSSARPAVNDLSFSVQPGECVALVGESGSGKSVSALSVMRLIEREGGRIEDGRIHFADEDGAVDLVGLDEPAMRRIRGNRIAMIFQEPMTSLNPVLQVGDQLAEVLQLHKGLDRAGAFADARRMLDRVRIPDADRRIRQYPHELSGGMRQRVMTAMALLCRPRLLIADEPTTALDVTVQAQILALIDELRRDIGMAVLFITHDLGVVAEVADRVVVMRHGDKREEATTAELFAAPRDAYTRELLDAVPRLGFGKPPAAPARGAEPVLSVRNLVKRFPIRKGLTRRTVANVHAVEGVSFDLHAGETLAIVGESGCGKSTTGRAAARLIDISEGTVTLRGQDVTHLTRAAMQPLRRNIQFIFQDPYASLNPRLSAFEAVTEPLAIHEPSLSREQLRERAGALLRRVGLEEAHLDRFPHQFSGGQRQRLCIARALSVNPQVIVADEPVSALDVSVQAQVIALMKELQEELGLSYIFISHDMGVVERISHRVAVMYLGQIVEIGPTAEVLGRPRHPYTRKLLASVPCGDPGRRPDRAFLDAEDLPSPVRTVGDPPARHVLTRVAADHFVAAAG